MEERLPTKEEVLEAVERICSSQTFRKKVNSKKLLRYIVKKHLAGVVPKEHEVGVDVFGFHQDWDAIHETRNPKARVEMYRLRTALKAYYEKEGASERIVIDLAEKGFGVDGIRYALEQKVEAPPPTEPKPTVRGEGPVFLDAVEWKTPGAPNSKEWAEEWTSILKDAEIESQYHIRDDWPGWRPTHKNDTRVHWEEEEGGRLKDAPLLVRVPIALITGPYNVWRLWKDGKRGHALIDGALLIAIYASIGITLWLLVRL